MLVFCLSFYDCFFIFYRFLWLLSCLILGGSFCCCFMLPFLGFCYVLLPFLVLVESFGFGMIAEFACYLLARSILVFSSIFLGLSADYLFKVLFNWVSNSNSVGYYVSSFNYNFVIVGTHLFMVISLFLWMNLILSCLMSTILIGKKSPYVWDKLFCCSLMGDYRNINSWNSNVLSITGIFMLNFSPMDLFVISVGCSLMCTMAVCFGILMLKLNFMFALLLLFLGVSKWGTIEDNKMFSFLFWALIVFCPSMSLVILVIFSFGNHRLGEFSFFLIVAHWSISMELMDHD